MNGEIHLVDLKYFIFKNMFRKLLLSFMELNGDVNLNDNELNTIIKKMHTFYDDELYFLIEDAIMTYIMKHKKLLNINQADQLYNIFFSQIKENILYEQLIIYYTDLTTNYNLASKTLEFNTNKSSTNTNPKPSSKPIDSNEPAVSAKASSTSNRSQETNKTMYKCALDYLIL